MIKRSQPPQQSKVELNIASLVNGMRDVYKGVLCFRKWTNSEAEATIASFDNNSEVLSAADNKIPTEDETGKELIAKMKEYELSFGHISRTAHEMHADDKIVVIESRHEVQRRNTAQDIKKRIECHAVECEEEKGVIAKRFGEHEAQMRKEYALKVAKIHNDIAQIEKPIIWDKSTVSCSIPNNNEVDSASETTPKDSVENTPSN